MNLPREVNKDCWLLVLDMLGLGILGFCCFLYSVYGSDFAERHISFPQLDFPVFVGEILLIGCMSLFFAKWRLQKFVCNRWGLLIICFMFWVIVNALVGHVIYGPLSFRNAALFYYPFFAVLSFSFFNKKLLSKFKYVLAAFLGLVIVSKLSSGYFWLNYMVLILFLLLGFEKPWLKVSGLICILLFGHLDSFFTGSRSGLVSSILAGIFVFIFFLKFYFNVFLKVLAMIFCIVFIFFGIKNFSDLNGVSSMINFGTVINEYKIQNKYIQERKKDFVFEALPIKLYHQNPSTILASPTSIDITPVSKIETSPALENKDLKQNSTSTGLESTESLLGEVEESASAFNSGLVAPSSKIETSPALENKDLKQNSTSTGLESTESLLGEVEESASAFNFWLVAPSSKKYRLPETAVNNILFRIFIWRDMFSELFSQKAFFGVGFGKPQRSESIEILRWAEGEWERDGWITPHNSFIHIIYRVGIIGVFFIIGLFSVFLNLLKSFVRNRSLKGILLLSAMVYWMTMANFLLIFELPHYAIPMWTMFGLALGYAHQQRHMA